MDSLVTLGSMFVLLSLLASCIIFCQKQYQKYRLEGEGAKKDATLLKMLDLLLVGTDPNDISKKDQMPKAPVEKWYETKAVSLVVCFFGLQFIYLVWGLMQEQLMTQEYENGDRFTQSSFLVLVNRIFAIALAVFIIQTTEQPHHNAPLIDYSFASVTNVLSSFCQYEALQYVSFPMQTVAKACKVIPTMLMGTFVQNKTYSKHDYIGAIIITVGVASFSYNQSKDSLLEDDMSEDFSKTAIGAVLLVLYLTFDSFTSGWQGMLFSDFKVSPVQCMLGINFFSALFTAISLVSQDKFLSSMQFIASHPSCLQDMFLMSLCSGLGQLFIFRTISKHGPITFTIISVVRQLFSIILSAFKFNHEISFHSWLAVLFTFSGILYRVFASHYFVSSNSTSPGKLKTK